VRTSRRGYEAVRELVVVSAGSMPVSVLPLSEGGGMISVTASGLTELLGGLVKAAAITPLAIAGVKTTGEAMGEAMQAEMPVLTGAMRDSVEVDAEGLSAEAGPTVPYAPFVNWGTYKDAPQDFIEVPAQAATDGLASKLLQIGTAL
jgi:hypothetical protein